MSVKKLHSLYFLCIYKDIGFRQIGIPYKGQVKDLEYQTKRECLHLEKKKTNRQSQFVAIV